MSQFRGFGRCAYVSLCCRGRIDSIGNGTFDDLPAQFGHTIVNMPNPVFYFFQKLWGDLNVKFLESSLHVVVRPVNTTEMTSSATGVFGNIGVSRDSDLCRFCDGVPKCPSQLADNPERITTGQMNGDGVLRHSSFVQTHRLKTLRD